MDLPTALGNLIDELQRLPGITDVHALALMGGIQNVAARGNYPVAQKSRKRFLLFQNTFAGSGAKENEFPGFCFVLNAENKMGSPMAVDEKEEKEYTFRDKSFQLPFHRSDTTG